MRLLKANMIACLLFAAAARANSIQLTLALDPSSALPGIPVTFRVTASNTGTVAARLPLVVRLEVTSEDGKRFFAIASGLDELNAPYPFPEDFPGDIPIFVVMEPGERRQLDFLAGPESPPWFCDERVLQPGMYRLRLVSDPNFGRGGSAGVDPIMSNEVVLTVEEPTGVDAEVWRLPHSKGWCRWWANLDTQLWAQYPTSTYTPLSVRPSPNNDRATQIDSLLATLDRNPPRGFADAYKETLSSFYVDIMQEALLRGDAPVAVDYANRARALLTPLAEGETEWNVKSRSRELLASSVLTPDDITRYVDNLHATDPRPPCETERVADVRDGIRQAIAAQPAAANARKKLDAVARSLDAYAAVVAATPPDMVAALHELEQAVGTLQTLTRSGDISETTASNWMKELLKAAEASAQKAIAAATNDVAVKSKTLEQAKQSSVEAQALVGTGDYHRAAGRFREALAKAEASSSKRGDYC